MHQNEFVVLDDTVGQSADSGIAMPDVRCITAAMRTKRTNPDFLNGVPELLLLSLLSRRPMYGYELVQAIRASTNGTLEFGEGCIYPILHRLEAEGMLASKRETVAGRSRVIYRVTAKGSKKLASSREHLAADRPGRQPYPARRRTWTTSLGSIGCGNGLHGNSCRQATFNEFMEELADHLEDLKEENMDAECIFPAG